MLRPTPLSSLALLILWSAAGAAPASAQVPAPQVPGNLPAPGPVPILAPGDRYEGVYTPDGQSNGAQDFVLWLPESPVPAEGYPLVIYVPGGGWREPSPLPEEPTGLNRRLRRRGYAVAQVRYSHIELPFTLAARFPQVERDVQTVVQHVRFHAQTYRIDPDRVLLSGRSAGAHAVQAAAMWPDAAEPSASDQRRESSRPLAVLVASVAATHVPSLRQNVNSPIATYLAGVPKLAFVAKSKQLEASPTEWVGLDPSGTRSVPFLIVGGPRPVEDPLGMPFVANALDHDHDPWNAYTLWFALRGLGGVHAVHSVFLDYSQIELDYDELFAIEAAWVEYVVTLEGAGLIGR